MVSETYGWFLHRLGEDAARTFRLALAELPRLQLLALTPEHHAAVGRKLERLRDRRDRPRQRREEGGGEDLPRVAHGR